MSNQEHTFIVAVGGCTAEQAEQVMRERICHEEEYGFDYDLGFSAKRLTDQSVIDNTLPGEAEIEVTRYEDGITVSLINEYTEHVNLTPDQATELAYVLLTLAGRSKQ